MVLPFIGLLRFIILFCTLDRKLCEGDRLLNNCFNINIQHFVDPSLKVGRSALLKERENVGSL